MTRSIQPEDRIAHYRVVGPLGSGGMGEVYLADDQKLERSVALKVLPFDLVRDEERVRRFVLEAKSASSLNHPNIVTIYEIGHEQVHAAGDDEPASDPIHYISMELVTGETLSDKIRSQKTDLKTLLGYLAQAAEGIAKAHGAGIAHRDLKPSNIMISQDGYAKVLDFGLAKLLEREAVSGDLSAATVPLQRTESGQALGTVGYMSPEQIRGGKVDHRSDIFSFGCVLYECVTRKRAFRAHTDVETLHQILHQEPTPVEELNPDVPRALQRLIKRCLARNPDRRLQSMKDLAIELQEIVDEYETLTPSSGSSAAVGSGGHPTVGGRRVPPVVLGLVAVVGIIGLVLGVKLWPGPKPAGVASRAQPRVTGILGDVSTCALSPDGNYLAYAAGYDGGQGLWIRQLATGSNVELSAAPHGRIGNISFSPDGIYVYFRPDAAGFWEIHRVPSLGGSPQRVSVDVDSRMSFSPDGRRACFRRGIPGAEMVTNLIIVDLDTGEEKVLLTSAGPDLTFRSPAWSPSGERIAAILAGRSDTLVVIDATTGRSEPLGDVWASASSCAWLPEDRGVVVTASRPFAEGTQIWSVSYPDGVVRRITRDQDQYGDVTVSADGGVVAAVRKVWPADLWSAPLTEEPAPRRLTKSSKGTGGMEASFAVVDDGSIVVVWGGQLRLVDGEGRQIRVITSTPDMRSLNPQALPEGVLFERFVVGEYVHHIWHVDIAGNVPTQLTSGPGEHLLSRPVPPGVFPYWVSGTWDSAYIGSVGGEEPRMVPGRWPSSISPDGRWVFSTEGWRPGRPARIVVRSMETLEPQLELEVGTPSDPRWTSGSDAIAYVLTAGEGEKIVLQPLDGGEPRSLLEISPGRWGSLTTRRSGAYGWSPDGESLCLRFSTGETDNLWVVASAGGELRPITNFSTGMIYQWEWAPDGQSVYFTRGNPELDAVLIRDFD